MNEQKMNELVRVIDSSEVEAQTALMLKEKFLPFIEQIEGIKEKSMALIVTDASQVDDMRSARQTRLKLRDIRLDADKTRKRLKEDSLRYGRAVQGVYNVIEYIITPIEKHLKEQEDFVAVQEAKRKDELKVKREMELEPYSEFIPQGLNLCDMSEDDFVKTLNGAKLQLQAKIESERIAKEKAGKERAENERIRLENERLANEAKQRESELLKAKAEILKAKVESERIAKEKADAENKAKAEMKRREEIQVENERLKKESQSDFDQKISGESDKDILLQFADSLEKIKLPTAKSKLAEKMLADAILDLSVIANKIRNGAKLI